MRPRSIVLLAGGVLAVALAPPVFGAGESTTPPPGSSAAPTTTTTEAPSDTPTTATTAPSSSATTATTAPDAGATTTTTAADPATDPAAPSDGCDTPETVQEPAPAEGESVTYPAGEAGEVEVSRASPTDLEVIEAVANDGWTAEVIAATGPRVKVRFVDNANPSAKTRFAASMDQKGEEIHVRVTNCS